MFFSGPGGSSLSNTASGSYSGFGTYLSPFINTPPYPPAGQYSVGYESTNFVFEIPNLDAGNKSTIPVPTAILNSGNLVRLEWAWKNGSGASASRR